MILLDSSGLFAALVRSQAAHDAARRALEQEPGPLLLSPPVLAELDYLLARWVGIDAELAFLDDVAAGAYTLAEFDAGDVADARDVVARYREQKIGLADASLVVLAARLGVRRVLTLDERHFRALRLPDGQPFTLVPADDPRV